VLPFLNNPAVSRCTRAWLGEISETGTLLDAECRLLIQPVLDKVRGVHPGGLVFSLSRELKVDEPRALVAGSVCEMFYAACSVTDDLQDGDTDAYFSDVPMSLRINAQVQLLSLVAVRLAELVETLDPGMRCALMLEPYRTLAIMLTGQRLELVRDPWDIATYERVARLSAGEQFGTYFRIAAAVADVEPASFVEYGRSFGTLLQIIADDETDDSRLRSLPVDRVTSFSRTVANDLSDYSCGHAASFLNELTRGVVKRCRLLSA
jgi:hypothetical protein